MSICLVNKPIRIKNSSFGEHSNGEFLVLEELGLLTEAVLDGFGEVVGVDFFLVCKVSNCASNLEQAMIATW